MGKNDNSCSAVVRYFAALAAGLVISGSAMAQNLGTVFTDLWWIPAESGWGVTIDHQQNFMFLTFFIYRADGSPYWVTALLQQSRRRRPFRGVGTAATLFRRGSRGLSTTSQIDLKIQAHALGRAYAPLAQMLGEAELT